MGNKLKLFAALLGVACLGITAEMRDMNGTALGMVDLESEVFPSMECNAVLKSIAHDPKSVPLEILELEEAACSLRPEYRESDLSFTKNPEDRLSFTVVCLKHPAYLIQQTPEGMFMTAIDIKKLPEELRNMRDMSNVDLPVTSLNEDIQKLILIPGSLTTNGLTSPNITISVKVHDGEFYLHPFLIHPPKTVSHGSAFDAVTLGPSVKNFQIGNILIRCHLNVLEDHLKEKCDVSMNIPGGMYYAFRKGAIDQILHSLLPEDKELLVVNPTNDRFGVSITVLSQLTDNKIVIYCLFGTNSFRWSGPSVISWKDFCASILSPVSPEEEMNLNGILEELGRRTGNRIL